MAGYRQYLTAPTEFPTKPVKPAKGVGPAWPGAMREVNKPLAKTVRATSNQQQRSTEPAVNPNWWGGGWTGGGAVLGPPNPNSSSEWWNALTPEWQEYYRNLGYGPDTPAPGGGGAAALGGAAGLFPEEPNYGWWSQLGKNYGLNWEQGGYNPFGGVGGWNTSDRYNAYNQPMHTAAPYGNTRGSGYERRGGASKQTESFKTTEDLQAELAKIEAMLKAGYAKTPPDEMQGQGYARAAYYKKAKMLQRRANSLRSAINGGDGGAENGSQGGGNPAYNSGWLNDLITWRSRD